jgi:hypothetical protein
MILTGRRLRRALAAMHSSLRESDPRLVARFTMFTELADGAAIPTVERVRLALLRRLAFPLRVLARAWPRAHRRERAGGLLARAARQDQARWWLGGALFVPAALAAMVLVMIVVNEGPVPPSCVPVHTAGHTSVQYEPGPTLHAMIGATCPASQAQTAARRR